MATTAGRGVRAHLATLLGVCGCLVIGGCEPSSRDSVSTDDSAEGTSSLTGQRDSARASALIDRLQKQVRVGQVTQFGRLGQTAGAHSLSTLPTPAARPLLGATSGSHFALKQGRLDAVWKEGKGPDISLPVRSTEAFRLRDPDSGVALEARLAD